ncbi:MAG: choice-of-anchor D domain-containing protein [Myxococcota bacterium]
MNQARSDRSTLHLAPRVQLCGLLLALASCDRDTVVGNAEIAVSPDHLDFPEVKTGSARSLTLSVENRSPTQTLRFSAFDVFEGSSPAFSLGQVPEALGPLEKAEVQVRYTADDGAADAGQIRLDSNAANAPRVLVPLTSLATAPLLDVTPARVEFGDLASGDSRTVMLHVQNRGLAELSILKWSLRTAGFSGEACARDEDCREGRCARQSGGAVCAKACDSGACEAGFTCGSDAELGAVCLRPGAPARAARGFSVAGALPAVLPPDGTSDLSVRYAPAAADRGSATLVIESSDPERAFFLVPLIGRPDNLPPIAAAVRTPPLVAVGPGTQIGIDGQGSMDPEGGALSYRWVFSRRPEGSRAEIAAPRSSTTSFTIDLPGLYTAALEVRDPEGTSSTNQAQVEVEAGAGRRVSVRLRWDRADADLDLHLVAPGAGLGTALDANVDNPSPDWGAAGSAENPQFSSADRAEQIDAASLADGVYTIAVKVAAPSLAGPTAAVVEVYFEDIRVSHDEVTLSASDEEWDVATMSRPSGRILSLGSIR